MITKPKTKPKRYQRDGVKMIDHFDGRSLIADDMGLGKSFQSLLWAHKRQIYPLVVVTRAGLKYNWQHEAKVHLGIRAEVLEGSKARRGYNTRAKIIIINHDILGGWMVALRKLRAKLVILDECQDYKNRKTKRTKNIRKLCKNRPYVLCLGGTGGLENRPAELFTVLNLLRPDKFKSFFSFGMRYCNPQKKPWGWEYKGATRLPELHRKLKKYCMIRRRKKDVLKDLPAKSRIVVAMELSAAARQEYQQAVKEFVTWLIKSKKTKRQVKRAMQAKALVQMGYLKRLVAELKLPSVIEWLDNFLIETNEKIIVFAWHKKILRAIYDRYKKYAVYIDGSVSSKKRHIAIKAYNRSKDKRMLVGQMQAAGVGWSAKSSTTAIIELPWKPTDCTQAEDRSHGLSRGVEGSVSTNYYLVARNTMEERLCRLLQDKQRVIDETLDGGDSTDDLDVFNQLMGELNSVLKKGK